MSVCQQVGGEEGERCEGLSRRKAGLAGAAREGKGYGKQRAWGRATGLGKEPGEACEPGRGRPHTRHCLDAAIIVSSNTQALPAQLKGSLTKS